MPRRTTPLVTEEYYHVYNRGVARQPIFLGVRDYRRFLITANYYRFRTPAIKLARFLELSQDERRQWFRAMSRRADALVAVIGFALMPNHIHLLVRQTQKGGISMFMGLLLNSYTRYFNVRHDRVGPVFQGGFKAVRIETNAQLLHVSRYIHLNPLVGHVVNEPAWRSYPWSSFVDFQQGHSNWLDLRPVLGQFISTSAYTDFVSNAVDYARSRHLMKHLELERSEIPRWRSYSTSEVE